MGSVRRRVHGEEIRSTCAVCVVSVPGQLILQDRVLESAAVYLGQSTADKRQVDLLHLFLLVLSELLDAGALLVADLLQPVGKMVVSFLLGHLLPFARWVVRFCPDEFPELHGLPGTANIPSGLRERLH